MDLSVAYGAALFAGPLGATTNVEQVVEQQQEVEEHDARPQRRRPCQDMYSLHLHIGRDDAHLLCVFIAVLILTLLLSSRR